MFLASSLGPCLRAPRAGRYLVCRWVGGRWRDRQHGRRVAKRSSNSNGSKSSAVEPSCHGRRNRQCHGVSVRGRWRARPEPARGRQVPVGTTLRRASAAAIESATGSDSRGPLGERRGGLTVSRLPPPRDAAAREQTRCARRPVRGRPQTSHSPPTGGVRTPPVARVGLGPFGEPRSGDVPAAISSGPLRAGSGR